MSAPTSLSIKVGLVRAGVLTDEKVVRAGSPVTLGRSERATLILSGPSMPASYDLLVPTAGGYVLRFNEAMTGKVSVGGQAVELPELARSGRARRGEHGYELPLEPRSRGRIAIGDTVILFQFVDELVAPARPVLPASVLGGGGQVDWTFAAFVVGSFIFHLGFGLFLSQVDSPVEASIAVLPEDLVQLVPEEPPEPEVDEETPQTEETDEPTETREQASDDRPSNESSRDSQSVENSAEAQASLADDVAAAVMNDLLGATGSSMADIVRDTMNGVATEGNLGDMLASASNTTATGGSGSRALREGAGGGGGGSGLTNDLGRVGAGGAVAGTRDTGGDLQEAAARRSSVRPSAATLSGGTGSFDTAIVNARLRALSASLNRCYEQALATAPNLEGRVGLQFTIVESGSVTGVQVDGGNPALQQCVQTVVGRLRFNPGPTDGSVRFSTAFVFQGG